MPVRIPSIQSALYIINFLVLTLTELGSSIEEVSAAALLAGS